MEPGRRTVGTQGAQWWRCLWLVTGDVEIALAALADACVTVAHGSPRRCRLPAVSRGEREPTVAAGGRLHLNPPTTPDTKTGRSVGEIYIV